MNIKPFLYRNTSEEIHQLICNKQCEMKKEKKREISNTEAINELLKVKYATELAGIREQIKAAGK